MSTGMLELPQSEAEFASILGHVIAHVDQRHCIEVFQSQIALERIGMDDLESLVTMARAILAGGYHKYQELVADAAVYEPRTMVPLFERLQEQFTESADITAKEPIGRLFLARNV